MGDSHNSKPSSRPGGTVPPAGTSATRERSQAPAGSPAAPEKPRPRADDTYAGRSGRVVHDDRGNAVWDWIKDTTRSAIDSTSRLLKKLEVPELTMEDTQNNPLSSKPDRRDAGGGYDPYGSSSPAKGVGRGEGSNSTRSTTFGNSRSPGVTNSAGGGYDPYGKGVTRKPGR